MNELVAIDGRPGAVHPVDDVANPTGRHSHRLIIAGLFFILFPRWAVRAARCGRACRGTRIVSGQRQSVQPATAAWSARSTCEKVSRSSAAIAVHARRRRQ